MTPALIGRDHPAGVLRAEIGRATDSHGGLVLVTGEAGIGKTSLVTDAARAARRRGALVLGGSCWASEGAPGFWPWVQVVRGLRRGASAEEWAAAEKATGGRLGVLLGEAPGGAAGAEPGAGAGSRGAGVGGSGSDSGVGSGAGSESGAVVSAVSGSDAFTLYDAVTTALVTVSQSRPVVVVIDDLHWADTASLKLLEFAAQHAWFERLLLICTYRDVEVDAADHPLQQLILPLVARATTVTLTGLERDEVGALMALTAGGREPERSVIDEVYRRTGGNPFYVEETARLWHSGSPVDTVAPGVREAVRRRLALLPEPVGSLLVTAAVLGREFHRKVLAATAGAPVPHVDRLLERAVTARLVVARTEGRFAFAHDLVRDTLYGALAEADVRQRHAQVVRALAASAALSEKVFPADLARHAYLAGAEIELDRALELLLAAARDASGRLATDEAVGHYRRALEVAEADGTVPRRAALIALDLGSELRHAGQMAEGWGYFDRAVVVARELSDAELLARVAITLHRYEELPGQEGVATGLLREAYRALIGDGTGEEGADGIGDGSGSSSGRGGGSGRGDGSGVGSGSGLGADAPGAVEAGLSPDRLAQDLAVRTTALARRGDDDEALAFGLWARHDSIWGLGTSDERLALTAEMATVARRTHDREMEMHASAMRWVTLLEQGDPRYYEQFRTFVAHAQQTALRRFELGVAVDQSLIAALTGHFAEAEELLGSESLTAHESEHAPFGFMAAHLKWGLLLAQGRFDEAAEVLTTLDEVHYPYPGLLEAVTAIERGDDTAALRHLAELSGTPEPYPRFVAPLWLRFQAQTAAASGDEALCERARDALAPYAGQWVVSLYGCDISGPVDLWLGLLAAARGQWDEAADSYTAAYESADRLRARPWAVRARLGLAETLLARGEGDADADAEGDSGSASGSASGSGSASAGSRGRADRIATLLAGVEQEASALGLRHIEARVHQAQLQQARQVQQARQGQQARQVRQTEEARAGDVRTDAYDGAPRPGAGAGTGSDAGGGRGAGPHGGVRAGFRTLTDNDAMRGARAEGGGAGGDDRAGAGAGLGESGRADAVAGGADRAAGGGRGHSVVSPSAGSAHAPPVREFRRDGAVWSLVFGGRAVHMPDAKGLRDLHTLLARPWTDVPAVQLLAPEGGELAVAARQLGGDPVLDDEAKARYRQRLELLDEEIDRATSSGQDRRAADYDRERQALLDELRVAAGLGGRTRRLGDEAERARKTVTARIRDTLRKLDPLHPELAAHLRASVSTGSTCAYRPDRPTDADDGGDGRGSADGAVTWKL